MISSNSRKILGLATSSLMVGASLVLAATPANAIAGSLALDPSSGKQFAVFNDDALELTTTVNSVTGPSSDATLSYIITNPDQHPLLIDFGGQGLANYTGTSLPDIDVTALKANGDTVSLANSSSGTNLSFISDADGLGTSAPARGTAGDKTGAILVEFDDADVTTLILSGMDFAGDLKFSIQPLIETTADTTDESKILTEAEREDLIDGTTKFGLDAMTLNDGNASVTVQSWIDTNSDITDIESTYLTASETITWYDPANVSMLAQVKQMRVSSGPVSLTSTAKAARNYFMPESDTNFGGLSASLKFNVAMNFDQIDIGDIKMGVESTDTTTKTVTRTAMDKMGANEAAVNAGDFFELTASNGKTTEVNQELLMLAWSGAQLDAGEKFALSFQHSATDADSNAAAIYKSPQFTVVNQTVDTTVDGGTTTVGPAANINEATSTTADLRVGATAITYTMQATASSENAAKANLPVVALVTAGSFVPTAEQFSVSGTTTVLDQADEAVMVTGLTDEDGKFAVTVTATEAAKDTQYKVEMFVGDGTDNGNYAAAGSFTSTYKVPTGTTFAVDNSVISAEEPTLTFTLEDVFGEAISESPTGLDYSVQLTAPNKSDLDEVAQIVDGSATISFTNWLAAGTSEVLTAKLYTGTAAAPKTADFVSGKTASITLYAPTAATAVLLSTDKITGAVVEYNDFITGKKDKVGPTSGTNSKTVQGTVVDTNGAGIPGTPVTLSAAGVQFFNGSTFSIGSVDLVTDAAGAFSAEVWVNEKSATGISVTASSGDLTDSLVIVSDLPVDVTGSATDALTRGNLTFNVDMPSTLVVNTTYAVTASVLDIYGNPVDNAVVKFDGFGSAQFNGVASVTKVTNRNGEAVAYLRSIKDVDGLSAIEISVTSVDHDADGNVDTESIASSVTTDVATTSWDETAWSNLYEAEVEFLSSAPSGSADAKVNAGSFKGYVAVYAKGYEGARLSAKIGNDWVIVDPIVNNEGDNLFRVTDFTGAGVDIAVRIYIDRVLMDTINLTTK